MDYYFWLGRDAEFVPFMEFEGANELADYIGVQVEIPIEDELG